MSLIWFEILCLSSWQTCVLLIFFGKCLIFQTQLGSLCHFKGSTKKYWLYLKASSSWIVGGKEFLIDFIDRCRVLYVIEQHSSFHNIVVGTASSFQNSSHVSQGLWSLGFNSSSNNLHCFGIKTNTSRNVQCLIHQYSLKQLIIRILIIDLALLLSFNSIFSYF